MGYHRAFPSALIIGVDLHEQPRYPFVSTEGDAMRVLEKRAEWCKGFDLIHASPPCQHYSDLAKRNGNADQWPDLVPGVRDALRMIGVPYVIENVEGAPLIDPVMLCGTMFPGLRVLRHRLFECSFHVEQPAHGSHPLVFTHDKRKQHYGKLDQNTSFVQVTGGGNARVANKLDAMGIDWMTGHEVNEAIPPAYTEHIGRQFALSMQRAA
jgi:DNA (cytosine-5)-methyltransferase 1